MGDLTVTDSQMKFLYKYKTLNIKPAKFECMEIDNEKLCYCCLNDLLDENYLINNFDFTKISILNLNNCDLTRVPICVRNMNLKSLELSKNKLEEVPICLYTGLETLESLDLSFNLIKTFDVEPNCCLNLKYLKLNDNSICNLPQWILAFRCRNLLEIDYNYNRISKLSCLSEKYDFQISRLEMKNCTLRDIDFNFLKNIKTLQYLDISNDKDLFENRFLDVDKLFVNFQWNNMNVLKFNNVSVSLFPEGLVWIESLTELYLRNCELSWLSNEIEYLVNLKVLDISLNCISCIPEQLANLEDLRVLKASNNKISFVPTFTRKMEILDLYNNQLEECSCDINEIDYLDIELNYFDTNSLEFFNHYEKIRDEYRLKIHEIRTNGKLLIKNYDIDDDDRSISTISSFNSDHVNYEISELENEENWDVPSIIYNVNNSLITPSDNEWDGQDELPVSRSKKKTKKVYNEDWMFCDAEDT